MILSCRPTPLPAYLPSACFSAWSGWSLPLSFTLFTALSISWAWARYWRWEKTSMGEDVTARRARSPRSRDLQCRRKRRANLVPWHWLDVSVSFTLSNVALYTPSCQPHFSSRTVDWPSTPRGRGAPLSSLTTEATTNTPPLGLVESSAA